MWLFTTHGFYSAVCPTEQSGKRKGQPQKSRVMVRARVKQHLQNLKDHFPVLKRCDIRSDAGNDYAYRIFMPVSTWADIVKSLAEEVDYTNFKTAATEAQGEEYHRALMQVWSVMHKLQPWRDEPTEGHPYPFAGGIGRLPAKLQANGMGEEFGDPFDSEELEDQVYPGCAPKDDRVCVHGYPWGSYECPHCDSFNR